MPEIDETQDAYHLSNAAVEQAAELDPRMCLSISGFSAQLLMFL